MENEVTIMDKKGKITIPAKIRKKGAFQSGSRFSFLETEEGILLIPLYDKDTLDKGLFDSDELKKIADEDRKIELEFEK